MQRLCSCLACALSWSDQPLESLLQRNVVNWFPLPKGHSEARSVENRTVEGVVSMGR